MTYFGLIIATIHHHTLLLFATAIAGWHHVQGQKGVVPVQSHAAPAQRHATCQGHGAYLGGPGGVGWWWLQPVAISTTWRMLVGQPVVITLSAAKTSGKYHWFIQFGG